MIWCPAVSYTAAGIQSRGDDGRTPHGIVNGWVWTVYLPWYPRDQRMLIYDAVIAQGYTHVAIHVGEAHADGGYHGLRPTTQEEANGYGDRLNEVHAELLAHGLAPICAGVCPEARPAPGFDTSQVLIAMNDWDNTFQAATRVRILHDTFPNALIYFERPHRMDGAPPERSADDPVTPVEGAGGQWIAAMQRQFPRFVGVLYEVNIPEVGVDGAVQQLSMAHAWWRDLDEILFETDTYWKFWDNRGLEQCQRDNDEVRRRCLQLKGYGSGGTAHPRSIEQPPDTGGGDATGEDMIDINAVIFVPSRPDIRSFAKTTTITRLEIGTSDVYVQFTKQDEWPEYITPGWKGPLQYSMGLCLNVFGQWFASAPVELWKGKAGSGGAIQTQDIGDGRSQIMANWFYDGRWGALHNFRVLPGVTIGFFVCAGDARNDFCPVRERSNIVTFPLPAPGQTAVYTWS